MSRLWCWRVCLALAALGYLSTVEPSLALPGGAARVGKFKLVTYNVAGLPEGLSRSRPLANLPIIGKLLNKYDVALVQEDFAYPLELRRAIAHGHASQPFVRTTLDFGDGLSQFTRLPFSEFRRQPWSSCNGVIDAFFDCLTPKGYTISSLAIADGVYVQLYNLHMDAGWSSADEAAREGQVSQLISAILRESPGQALIVAGDTNILAGQQHLLDRLKREAELEDVCAVVRCSEPWRIDRILYRSSAALSLRSTRWRIDREFVDQKGRPLSDHLAVGVDFEWSSPPDTAPRPVSVLAPKNSLVKEAARILVK